VVARELAFQLSRQPLSALEVLTGGAMSVSAGAIEPMELAAGVTLVEGNSQSLGAAGEDSMNDLAVCLRDSLGETFEVFGAEISEDLINCGHGPSPPLPD